VDEVIVLTGFRPDLSFLAEVRLGLDERLQAPTALAPLIDPNAHSCGTVYPHGVKELSHPEKGVYLVGMKSYGRAPTFLAMTGYEQVRSIAASIAGDQEAAERVELTLPETGVCGGAGLFDDPDATRSSEGGGCCSAPATLRIGIGAPASSGGC
ncbi:flavoprotein, partial [Streptomyces sp. NPDC057757]